MKPLLIAIITLALANAAHAAESPANTKEVGLILSVATQYPMTASYRFVGDDTIYGQGTFHQLLSRDTRKVYVNRIPKDQSVLVQIDKMTVGGVTEINDPCEIRLDNPHLDAHITIGFTGDPTAHGAFHCITAIQS